MDWGTISSWIAAAIAVLTYALTVFRSWWNRPQIDWLFTGDLRYPDQRGDWLEVKGTLANVGDGNAHRVTLWVHHNERWTQERLHTVALLRPGDTTDFVCPVHVKNIETTELWVTWTPPPLRRRSEDTSPRRPLVELFRASDLAHQKARKGPENAG